MNEGVGVEINEWGWYGRVDRWQGEVGLKQGRGNGTWQGRCNGTGQERVMVMLQERVMEMGQRRLNK